MLEISAGVRSAHRWVAALLIAAAVGAGCASKLVVHQVKADMPRGQGVFYALPKTVLLVQVPVVVTESTRGELADVTGYFFPFDASSAISANNKAYGLGTPTLSAFGVPDATHVYMVDVRGGRLEDKKLNMTFGDDGVLQRYEAESHNRTAALITQIIKTGAGVASKALSGGAMSSPEGVAATDSACTAVAASFSDHLRAVILAECLSMPPALRTALLSYVDQAPNGDLADKRMRASRFVQGWITFQRIRDLQLQRTSVFSAQNVPPGQSTTYTEILRALDDEISSLMEKFFGSTQKKPYWSALHEVTPAAFGAGTQSVTLFRFSSTNGICDPAGGQAAPAAGGVAPPTQLAVREPLAPPARSVACDKPVDVVVRVTRPGNQFADVVQTVPAPMGERGLFYRVPGKAFVSVATEQDEPQKPEAAAAASGAAVASQSAQSGSGQKPAAKRRVVDMAQFAPAVAQFGAVVSLPPTTGGRKTQYTADLFSATGALRSFVLGSESVIEASMVADVGAAATDVIGGLQARRAARDERASEREAAVAAGSDELAQLKRQADILEAQLRVKKAEEALSKATSTPPQ